MSPSPIVAPRAGGRSNVLQRADRNTRTTPAAAVLDRDAEDVAALGEDAVETSGLRWRTRRYSTAHILAQDAEDRLNELERASVQAAPCDADTVLDLATRLFEDPSDAFAALDVLSQREDLASFADVFKQAKEFLCARMSPRVIIAGLEIALSAKALAAQTGVPAVDLRAECRRFMTSLEPVHVIFVYWLRTYDERRRRIMLRFVSEEGETVLLTRGWDESCVESDCLMNRLRILRRFSGAEHAFVVPLLTTAAQRKLPMRADAGAVFALLFGGIVSGELTSDAIVEWFESLGIATPSARAVMAAAVLRSLRLLAPDTFVAPNGRVTLIERFEAVLDVLVRDEHAATPALIRTGIA
ncbi:MAG TPA: HrpJ domain-containing protein [Pararobbsia sp.]|nr:HrpJ domain-containing protein [Pararobbsia sp.]